MFEKLSAYDPATVDPKYRLQMGIILKARAELLTAAAEIAGLRARSWSGEQGLTDLIDLKAQSLAKLREDFGQNMLKFLQDVVDLDSLKALVPMIMMAGMQSLKVPLPVIAEAMGLDFDLFKMLAEAVKELVEGLQG